MYKWILLFLLISSVCFGQISELSGVPTDTLLTKEQQAIKKAELTGKIFKGLTPAKNDYVSKLDRGTVHFNNETIKVEHPYTKEIIEKPANGNYSFHKVIIPDGTTVKNRNFSQKEPHTEAIQGKDLTFVECNLVNVKIDDSWTIINSNTSQIKRVKVSEESDTQDGKPSEGKRIRVSYQLEKNGKFEEVSVDEESVSPDDYADYISQLNK